MRVIRHWWPNCRKYTAYEVHLTLHWYGFTAVLAVGKSTGVFAPVFFESIPWFIKGSVTPADVYPWELE